MKAAHKGMGITDVDWKIAVDLFTTSLDKHHIAAQEHSEFLQNHPEYGEPDRWIRGRP